MLENRTDVIAGQMIYHSLTMSAVSRRHKNWMKCVSAVFAVVWIYLTAQAFLYQPAQVSKNEFVFLREYKAEDLAVEQQSVIQCDNIVEQPLATHTTYEFLQNTDSLGGDLFPVRSTDPLILRKMCDVLETCVGFNTNGWLKKSTKKKYKAKIDLYIKKEPHAEEVYLSSRTIQENYGRNYLEMTKHLKIYIYNITTGLKMKSPQDYKYGVETLFIQLLQTSAYTTENPEKATFFFIPTRCTAYRKSVDELSEGVRVAQYTVTKVLQEIKSLPYWSNSEGADHFYICAHDMGAASANHADNGLLKNAIALVNTADYADSFFVPHKDISLPPHPAHGVNSLPYVGRGGQGTSSWERKILAFFAGNLDRGRIRPRLKALWGEDPDFRIIHGSLPDVKYRGYLITSKFCLCPRGNEAWSPRLMDAIWFGCVPVILSDYYHLPLQGLIDWNKFSVIIPESQIDNLKEMLNSVSQERLGGMQKALRQVYGHLTWNDPPRPYDAFHSILFQLWQRRHILRYNTN